MSVVEDEEKRYKDVIHQSGTSFLGMFLLDKCSFLMESFKLNLENSGERFMWMLPFYSVSCFLKRATFLNLISFPFFLSSVQSVKCVCTMHTIYTYIWVVYDESIYDILEMYALSRSHEFTQKKSNQISFR